MNKDQLYLRLKNLRDRLKIKFYANGKTPTICSDDAVKEMAIQAPRHKEDLTNITGIGQTFVDKYGDYFMAILNQYHNSNISTKQLDSEMRYTLKNLENRLVNISRRNRLLYMGRIYNKYAYDLCSQDVVFNDRLLEFLQCKKAKFLVCRSDDETSKDYKSIQALLREINRDYRENGQYDLYIGYPYVMGKIKGEDFNVRAPLMLIPVVYERDEDKVTIEIDDSRDVLFNNNLILLQNKFLGKNGELPNNVYDYSNFDNIVSDITKFYADNGIDLACDKDITKFTHFQSIRLDQFPKFRSGEMKIVPNVVLGKFSLYSSALQKDFEAMIEDSQINDLLDELLSGMEDIDFRIEDSLLEDVDEKDKYIDFSEKNLYYINDLNSSQEQAILSIDKGSKLVIQGPPGTGKSQTITSLIADAVNKGHNVLMVSQKKAALDVIYSRLGNLARYTMMLTDVKDKDAFYKQLYDLMRMEKRVDDATQEFNTVSDGIDTTISALKDVANILYVKTEDGVEMYKLYRDKNSYSFKADSSVSDIFFEKVSKKLLGLTYSQLVAIRNKFENTQLVEQLFSYIDVITSHPYVQDIRGGMKVYDVKQMEKDCTIYAEEQKKFLAKGFFARLFGNGKRNAVTAELMNKYFWKKKYQQDIFKNPDMLLGVSDVYFRYNETKEKYSVLESEEKAYIETLYQISKTNPDIATNDNLYYYLVNNIIEQFEHDNSEVLRSIANFDSLVKDVNKLIGHKKDVTKTKFRNVLIYAYFGEIYKSKRFNEMSRQIESTRKWNVSKFVKKFGYELFKGIRVWLMTPESVSEVLPLEKGLFDILIFDEASQIYIEKGIPAISRTHKVVIAGDHKQLRPSSLGFGRIDNDDSDEMEDDDIDENAALEEESLLDLARFKYPSVLLNYHYRSKYEELINFSNYAFYDGRLNVSPNVSKPDTPPIEVIKIDNGMWVDRCNRNEAEKVVETVKNILYNRQDNETMGVITFNSNQRDMIMDLIDDECAKNKEFATICRKEMDRKEKGEDVGLFVKNIENVQGDERDIIIFSIGYAKNEKGKVVRNFGWLNQMGGENRLNVAISRAKRKIYIVTSIMPEELYVDDLKNDGPKKFRKYLEYCWAINDGDVANEKRILQSFVKDKSSNIGEDYVVDDIANSLASILAEKGLNVETGVGVGSYKVDLAIKDPDNKRYLVGIEFDAKLYDSAMMTRERDVFRQLYLESRGWKLYRLWSNNWWHDRDKEVNNIINLYNKMLKK